MSNEIYRAGKLRGEKVQYEDGIGCCIWYPLSDNEEDDDIGICFDFSFSDIDSFIELLQKLKTAKADVFKDPERT